MTPMVLGQEVIERAEAGELEAWLDGAHTGMILCNVTHEPSIMFSVRQQDHPLALAALEEVCAAKRREHEDRTEPLQWRVEIEFDATGRKGKPDSRIIVRFPETIWLA